MDAEEAFNVLISELGSALELAQEEGTQAFQEGHFIKAQSGAQRAEVIRKHVENLTRLQENWESILSKTPQRMSRQRKSKRTHLSPGMKTPDKAFRIPILKALVEMGGTGPVKDILSIVERTMGDKFNEYDRALLKDGRSVRWRNTAQWERQNMKKEGLVNPNSPRGVWEISNAGRKFLEEHKTESEASGFSND